MLSLALQDTYISSQRLLATTEYITHKASQFADDFDIPIGITQLLNTHVNPIRCDRSMTCKAAFARMLMEGADDWIVKMTDATVDRCSHVVDLQIRPSLLIQTETPTIYKLSEKAIICCPV